MRARLRPDLAVLAVRGDDARSWLNGQVTNDVRSTSSGQAVHALVLNVKGRILADVTVLDRGEGGLAMVIPRSEHDALAAHLEKYVIMEDVALALETLDVAELHGEAGMGDSPAGERFATPWLGEGVSLFVGPADALARLPRIEEAEAEAARVAAGRPAFGADFGPTTYPQEAGLDSAVSFQKGCYLGQEVVCMLENRGQLSRLLARLEPSGPVRVGARVLDESGAELGGVTSVAGSAALGYLKRAAVTDGRTLSIDGVPARVVGPARG